MFQKFDMTQLLNITKDEIYFVEDEFTQRVKYIYKYERIFLHS